MNKLSKCIAEAIGTFAIHSELYEQLKRKGADLTKTVVEKILPRDVVSIY